MLGQELFTLSKFDFHVYSMPSTDDISKRIIPLRNKEKFFLAKFFNKCERISGVEKILIHNFSEL